MKPENESEKASKIRQIQTNRKDTKFESPSETVLMEHVETGDNGHRQARENACVNKVVTPRLPQSVSKPNSASD